MGLSQSSKTNVNSQPAPPKKKEDPGQQIQLIMIEAQGLRSQVEKFRGNADSSEYRYLDEMLTTFMLRLDNVDTGGKEDIRQARKSAVIEIQSCITMLESKVDLKSS